MSAALEKARNERSAEAPSGKGARDENFPVGSFLLPRRLRPHVAVYYAFARAIDDIADNASLAPAEKIRRLQGFDAALRGEAGWGAAYEKAHRLRESMQATGVPAARGSDLVAAFIQDCTKLRYHSWEELLQYCSLSANPVGRYLLDLHGEDPGAYRYSDALCTVLQIVNHLQDCGDDRRNLDRVYVIDSWLAEEGGAIGDLDQAAATPALRRVMDRMLDGCDMLMADARILPRALECGSLAMESAVIVRLADRLIALLRRGDPLARRVALDRFDFARAAIAGAIGGSFAAGKDASKVGAARRQASQSVRTSGTSFAAGMAILPKAKRRAMHALYAFCREVDDIADDLAPVADKRRRLAVWRDEIERVYAKRPNSPAGLALVEPTHLFNLPKGEFLLIIEGMEMDAMGPIIAPTMPELFAYTRRVAGAVGMLSMPIFGAPSGEASDRFALALGDALQITNILRDVREDAELGRLYLPEELLDKHGAPKDPARIVGAAGTAEAAEDLAGIAERKFADARRALESLDWRAVRPALLMMGVYEAYLAKTKARGWDRIGERVNLSSIEKIAVAVRYAAAPPRRPRS